MLANPLVEKQPSLMVPIIALALYAVASGYLMSLLPLMLEQYGLAFNLASWLASAFYAGLLLGAMFIEPLVSRFGHKSSFIVFLILFAATISIMPIIASKEVWLFARFIAGIAVAGIFVVVESWLLSGDEAGRTRRLGIYMAALYGGSTLGQLGIGLMNNHGMLPFSVILVLLLIATFILLFAPSHQPSTEQHLSLTIKQIFKLSKASIIGCLVSGLLLGAMFGLMPVELHHRQIDLDNIGRLMALMVLGGMAVQPIISWLSNYVGPRFLMALFCLLGVFAAGVTTLGRDIYLLATGLFLLGMAIFALYPIAITLGCNKLSQAYIVSATQVMLLSYSIGSVVGPLVADKFMHQAEGLMGYLFTILLATAIYMLLASLKCRPDLVPGK